MELLFLCLKIFFARILDVSMGTIRTMFVVKEKRSIATIISFIEVLIWFLIVKEALNTNVTSIWVAISYAGGFAIGTYIGSILSTHFIKGIVGVQVISKWINLKEIDLIKEAGYGVSTIKLDTKDKVNKYMLFIQVNSTRLRSLTRLIKKIDKEAFIIVNDTKYVFNGYIK